LAPRVRTPAPGILTIDKGSNGLKPDMAVITPPDCIVVKLRDVFRHTSQVLVISDQTSGAGWLLESTNAAWGAPGNPFGSAVRSAIGFPELGESSRVSGSSPVGRHDFPQRNSCGGVTPV